MSCQGHRPAAQIHVEIEVRRVVVPLASIAEIRPSNVPVEDRVPLMPSIVDKSAS